MMKSPDARPASATEARALLDLIERDRAAAATALGIAPAAAPPPGARRPPTTPPAASVATQRVAGLQGAPPRRALRRSPARLPTVPAGAVPGLPAVPARRVPGLPVEATTRVAPIAPAPRVAPVVPLWLRQRMLAGIVFATALAVTLLAALVVLHVRR